MDTTATAAEVSSVKSFFQSLTLQKLIPVALILVIGFVIAKLLMKLFDRMLRRSHIEKSAHAFLRSAFHILLYTIVILIAAGNLGVDVSSLVAILSVASLAISLAVQGALSNLAGGIAVLTTHPFRVGDFVEIGAVSGTVKEIGMSYTRLCTVNNKEVFVPNSEISSTKIINCTMNGRLRVDLTVSASYRDDTAKVCAALLRAARTEGVLSEPAPFAAVNAYRESGIEYALRVWAAPSDYWDVYFRVTERVRACFLEDGVHMPYPQLDVHLKEEGRA